MTKSCNSIHAGKNMISFLFKLIVIAVPTFTLLTLDLSHVFSHSDSFLVLFYGFLQLPMTLSSLLLILDWDIQLFNTIKTQFLSLVSQGQKSK